MPMHARLLAQIDATQPTPAAVAAAAAAELTRARACPLVGRPLQVDPHPGRPERSARAACDIHGMDQRTCQRVRDTEWDGGSAIGLQRIWDLARRPR